MTPVAPEKSAVYERSRLSMNWFLIFDFYGFFLIAVRERGGVAWAVQDWLGLPFDRAHCAPILIGADAVQVSGGGAS